MTQGGDPPATAFDGGLESLNRRIDTMAGKTRISRRVGDTLVQSFLPGH